MHQVHYLFDGGAYIVLPQGNHNDFVGLVVQYGPPIKIQITCDFLVIAEYTISN